MQVNLTDAEVAALNKALNSYLPNLREEIGRTDNYEWRQELHTEEASLTSLLVRIGGLVADTNLSDIGAKNPPWGHC
jgi:hypothetical protein